MAFDVHKVVDELQNRMNSFKLARLLAAIFVVISVSTFSLGAFAAPNVTEIANKVTVNMKKMDIMQADLQIEMFDNKGRVQNMTARVTADQKRKTTRLEILKHPVLEGQIVVLDLSNDQAIVYMPVTSAAVRGTIETVGSQVGGLDLKSLDIEGMLSLDPAEVLSMKYLRTEAYKRIDHYVIEVKTKISGSGTQIVWVDSENYLIKKVEVFDDSGKNIANVVIDNFTGNFSYDTAKLKELPKGTKITDLR